MIISPRTDAKWQELIRSSHQWPRVAELMRDFAKELEAEITELNKRLADRQSTLINQGVKLEQIRKILDKK